MTMNIDQGKLDKLCWGVLRAIPWFNAPEGVDFWVDTYNALCNLNPNKEHNDALYVTEASHREFRLGARDLLIEGFRWGDTPQGFAWWDAVDDVFVKVRERERLGVAPVRPAQPVDLEDIRQVAARQARNAEAPRLKSKTKDIRSRLVNRLESQGWERIASGAFSVVYGKDGSDQVIKVSKDMDSWPEYIQWAREEGLDGTFAPKVHALKVITKDCLKPFYIARMDRLEETASERAMDADDEEGEKLNDFHKTLEGICYATDSMTHRNRRHHESDLAFVEEVQPGIVENVTKFRERFQDGGGFDLHTGNWMYDKAGNILLTDPLAGSDTSKSEGVRIKSNASVRMAA
jgi:hypothetical protein